MLIPRLTGISFVLGKVADRLWVWLFLVAVVLGGAVLYVYWAGLHGAFFFDDEVSILLAEGVRLQELSYPAFRQAIASGYSGPFGRVLAQLSFALNYYLAGYEAFAYKATNLAIHTVNGLLVFVVGGRLVAACYPHLAGRQQWLFAAIVASLWLLHPLQLTTVLLVVQRMTSLSALFLLVALLLHMRGRDSEAPWAIPCFLMAWCVFWPFSMLSKESGVLFPFFVLAWEMIVRRHAQGTYDTFCRGLLAVCLLAVVLASGYALSANGAWLWAGYEFRDFSLVERLLTEGRVLWFYLGLGAIPSLERLALHHDYFVVSRGGLVPWTTLLAWAGIVALLGIAWGLRRRLPLAAFGIAWFFVGHALESTVLPLEIAHEHRNYLPLMGALLAASACLYALIAKPGPRRTLGVSVLCAFLAYCMLLTYLRSDQFSDDLRRVQVEVEHHPDSVRAQYEAGQMFLRGAENGGENVPAAAFSRRHFEKAMALDPSFKMAGLGLIVLDCLGAKKAIGKWRDELVRRFSETRFLPGDTAFFYGLKELSISGRVCLGSRDVDALFAAAINNPKVPRPTKAVLHSWHADYLWLVGRDLVAAKATLGESLELVPSNQSNRLKWAQLLYIGGDLSEARGVLLEVRQDRISASEKTLLDNLMQDLQSGR